MDSKAQISAEFFVFLGLAFLIAIAFAIASLDQLNDFRIQKESEAVKDLALKLQKEALIAATVEDGYVRIFEMPQKLENVNYSLITRNNTLTVQTKNSLYVVAIPKAIGSISKGTNIIDKTNGMIYINGGQLPSTFSDSGICQNAQYGGLCAGLDIAYGAGYQAACCSEHGLCCP